MEKTSMRGGGDEKIADPAVVPYPCNIFMMKIRTPEAWVKSQSSHSVTECESNDWYSLIKNAMFLLLYTLFIAKIVCLYCSKRCIECKRWDCVHQKERRDTDVRKGGIFKRHVYTVVERLWSDYGVRTDNHPRDFPVSTPSHDQS